MEQRASFVDATSINATHINAANWSPSLDHELFEEIGRLTRGVHEALKAFESEASRAARQHDQVGGGDETVSSLEYVIAMTDRAANKTLDLAEAAIPLARGLATTSANEQAKKQAETLQGLLNDIVLAQDYQDLSSQIIRRVVGLVKDVEGRLLSLLTVAARVRSLSGLHGDATSAPMAEVNGIAAEGPVLASSGRTDAVHGQDQVDDLLAKLGF